MKTRIGHWVVVQLPWLLTIIPQAQEYQEQFRPQFHFSPARNWMNDPNGMVYYAGEYHLFYQYNPFGDKWGHMSWGHAVSPDLVHWEQLPLAIPEENKVMIFSGSAVVDRKNTSGLATGKESPLIAIYTGHHTNKRRQDQRIAVSHDKGRTWTKYSGNPVLDIGEADFRDPKVIWHEPTQKWIMTVSMPTERRTRFYSSPNLIDWQFESAFGPAGAVRGIWECPDLFPLKVEDSDETKWVLIVNIGSGSVAGGSGTQYFVGDFDGKSFVADPFPPSSQPPDFSQTGRVFEDFESDHYGGWLAEGTAFGSRPANGTLPKQMKVSGFIGTGLINTFLETDRSKGVLTSPSFLIENNYINFKIGGGSHQGETGIQLIIDDTIARESVGNESESLMWQHWDVKEFANQTATIRIVDHNENGWGHILVDQIMFSDIPAASPAETANWVDFGKDFYAAVSWSDVPKTDNRRLWLGWLSNWQYAQDVPTSPWRSAQSIVRQLGLVRVDKHFLLKQTPVSELHSLRSHFVHVGETPLRPEGNENPLKHLRGMTMEMKVEIEIGSAQEVTMGLRVGKHERTLLGYHVERQELYVDRSQSGITDFNPHFSGRHTAPLALPPDDRLRLHILQDWSSIEIFANDGTVVFTESIFPQATSDGLTLHAQGGDAKLLSLDAWQLQSAWFKEPR